MGSIPVRNSAIHLSRTPALISKPGPRIGQHTFEILVNDLNKNPDQIADLAIKEIFE
jgi:crotonobetainyl-CoA:carnitine CoA-transferase CaiB-like acyl-CoA transferase